MSRKEGFYGWAEMGVKLSTPMCIPVVLTFGEYVAPDGQHYRFVSIDKDNEPVWLDDEGERVPFKQIVERFAS